MDLGRLGKKARNELMRNPKKSAVLGVICLVALYFWLPLLRGWLPGGKAKKGSKVVAKVEVVAAATPAASAPSEAESPKSQARAEAAFRWDKQVRQRNEDPHMSPATIVAGSRNPFRLSEDVRRELSVNAAAADEAHKPQAAPVAIIEQTPQQLGLILKGTLVGSRIRAATINSRTYREGSHVKVRGTSTGSAQGRDVSAGAIEFTLADVRKDSVVLTCGEKSYTLAFPKPANFSDDLAVQEAPAPVVEAAIPESEE